jgi:hypothetical protein
VLSIAKRGRSTNGRSPFDYGPLRACAQDERKITPG